MPYESIHQGMPVISDDNADQFVDPVVNGERRVCAAMPRDLDKYPRGGTGFAALKPFKTRSHTEKIARIKERQANKSGLADLMKDIPVKDQDGTNYCWIYAAVHAVEMAYAAQGEGYVALSATAAGTRITGGQNRGGYGAEAIDFLSKHGTCREKDWPEHRQNPRLWTPEVESIAQQNIVSDWGELPFSDLDQLDEVIFANYGAFVGLSWWRHEIFIYDHALLSGDRIGYRFRNSWSPRWGENGHGILTPEKARGDMFYPISVKPRDRALLNS